MKFPRQPPDPKPLSSSKLQKVLGSDSKYRHWDILRHLDPPNGLTSEEWWSGLKLLRMQGRKSTPLDGFSYTLPDQFLNCLYLMEGTVVELEEEQLNPFHFLTEEAITSSQIEGAATTRKVAKEMLRSGRLPRNESEQMIFNNYHVMQRLRDWREEPLTLELILEIHKIVCSKTLEKPGALRTTVDQVEVVDVASGQVLHRPPPAGQLPRRLKKLCLFANGGEGEFIHPIVRAILLHFWLAYEHPFVDGNGRTARALFYWLLLREGYWIFEYISISQIILRAPVRYAEAFLYTETDGGDLTYFLMHQVDVIMKALDELKMYVKRKLVSSVELPGLNERQLALVSHALKHPDGVYTVAGHRNSHGVVYETARRDLLELFDEGFLELEPRGKAFTFRPSKKLSSMV